MTGTLVWALMAAAVLALALPVGASEPSPEHSARYLVKGSGASDTSLEVTVEVRGPTPLVLVADSLDGPSEVAFDPAAGKTVRTLAYTVPTEGFWRLRFLPPEGASSQVAAEFVHMALEGYSDARSGMWAPAGGLLARLPAPKVVREWSVAPSDDGGHVLPYALWPLTPWMAHGYLHTTFGDGWSVQDERFVYSGGAPIEWSRPVESATHKPFRGQLFTYLHIDFTGERDATGHLRLTLDCLQGDMPTRVDAQGRTVANGSPCDDPDEPWPIHAEVSTEWPPAALSPSGDRPPPEHVGPTGNTVPGPALPIAVALLLGLASGRRRR